MLKGVAREDRSERLVGIEVWRLTVRDELLAPSLLYLWSVSGP